MKGKSGRNAARGLRQEGLKRKPSTKGKGTFEPYLFFWQIRSYHDIYIYICLNILMCVYAASLCFLYLVYSRRLIWHTTPSMVLVRNIPHISVTMMNPHE